MRSRWAAAAAFMLAVACATPGAAGAVLPVDHAKRDKALADTRDRLAAVVARKDFAALAQFVAADARVAGKNGGAAALIAWLRREPALWEELERTLALGGKLTRRDLFEAPYTRFARQKGVPHDELGIVLGRSIAAYDGPTEKARIMARYSVETVIVKRWWVATSHADPTKADGAAIEPWVEIELPSKRRGYMAKRWVRWVGGLRISFTKRGGRWWVTEVETGG